MFEISEFFLRIIILLIIIVFGVIITLINVKKKIKKPVKKEQKTWQRIEELNNNKKELLKKKEELSFKYSAKTIKDEEYSNLLNYINSELKKIDENINQEVSKLTEIQEKNDPINNQRFENIKLKGDLNKLKLERDNLKKKVEDLEGFIKNLSKNDSITTPISEKAKINYYEMILKKYKDEINKNEKKTITEIKEMIKPDDLTIESITSKYKPIGYDFEKDYILTLKKIYNYLKSEINVIKNDLKILFWIDFAKIMKYKISDEQDIAILLCSIMLSLGDANAKIYIVMLEDEKVQAFVETKYKNTYYILDISQKTPFDMFKNKNEDELFKEYKFNNKRIIKKIYSYNLYEYSDYRSE